MGTKFYDYEVVSSDIENNVLTAIVNVVDENDNIVSTITCEDNLPANVEDFIKEGGCFTFKISYGVYRVGITCTSNSACKLMCLSPMADKPTVLQDAGENELTKIATALTEDCVEYRDIAESIIEYFIKDMATSYGINGILQYLLSR